MHQCVCPRLQLVYHKFSVWSCISLFVLSLQLVYPKFLVLSRPHLSININLYPTFSLIKASFIDLSVLNLYHKFLVYQNLIHQSWFRKRDWGWEGERLDEEWIVKSVIICIFSGSISPDSSYKQGSQETVDTALALAQAYANTGREEAEGLTVMFIDNYSYSICYFQYNSFMDI